MSARKSGMQQPNAGSTRSKLVKAKPVPLCKLKLVAASGFYLYTR